MQPATLLLLTAAAACASGSRILGLFPYRGASHLYVFQALMEGLAMRGHDVTVVSHLPRKEPLANYHDVSLVSKDDPTVGFMNVTEFLDSWIFTENLLGLEYLAQEYDHVISKPEVLELADSSFDVVIIEMFNSDLFFGLAHKIGAPIIGFSSCSIMPWTADSLAVPNAPSYLMNNLGDYGIKMNILERIANTLQVWVSRLHYRFNILGKAQALAEKYLGPLPDLADIAANTSLLFVNTHFAVTGQRPLPPSVIEVGGISVRQAKPLPKDLDSALNNSKGAIYFSLGSVLIGGSFPQHIEDLFISAFSESGKTVLWKRENDMTKGEAEIIARTWFPQRDVLAHPKTELFISHCGLLGLTEAVASGVPVICIPFYGDQPFNAKAAEESGYAIVLNLKHLTKENIHSAIMTILNDKRYKERALEVSSAFRHRAMPPLETAIYWTEYLIRHGPQAFRSSYSLMSPWKRDGIDLLIVAILIYELIRRAVNKVMPTRKGQVRDTKKIRKNKQN